MEGRRGVIASGINGIGIKLALKSNTEAFYVPLRKELVFFINFLADVRFYLIYG
jgi:hypothetical protein